MQISNLWWNISCESIIPQMNFSRNVIIEIVAPYYEHEIGVGQVVLVFALLNPVVVQSLVGISPTRLFEFKQWSSLQIACIIDKQITILFVQLNSQFTMFLVCYPDFKWYVYLNLIISCFNWDGACKKITLQTKSSIRQYCICLLGQFWKGNVVRFGQIDRQNLE